MLNDGDPDRGEDNVIEMRWVLQREFGSDVVFFHEVTIPPGTIEGTHRHIGSEELYYIVAGEGIAYMQDGDDPANDRYPLVERPIYGLGPAPLPRAAGQGRQRHLHQERRRARHPQPGHASRCASSPSSTRGAEPRWRPSSTPMPSSASSPAPRPDYDNGNTMLALLAVVEQVRFAAERECYDAGSLQYLLPLSWLELWGPSPPDTDNLDPANQDNKNDFQKQNVRRFHLADTQAARGWAAAGDWRGPFPRALLPRRARQRAGRGRRAARRRDRLSPVDPRPRRGDAARALRRRVGPLLRRAVGPRPDLRGRRARRARRGGGCVRAPDRAARPRIRQRRADFERMAVDGRDMRGVSSNHTMHPILPLYLDVHVDRAARRRRRDRRAASPRLRDARARLGQLPRRSASAATRTAASARWSTARCCRNYGAYAGSGELARILEPYNFDAHGNKGHASGDREAFMAVDYMDLHILEPACGIGLHRHRDNQEIFFMLQGEGIMVIGDWADSGRRTRSFEVRRLAPRALRDAQGWQPARADEPRRQPRLAVHVRRLRLSGGRRARRRLGRAGHELLGVLDRRRGRALPAGRRRRRAPADRDGGRAGHLERRRPRRRPGPALRLSRARPVRPLPRAALRRQPPAGRPVRACLRAGRPERGALARRRRRLRLGRRPPAGHPLA